jgi:hypothetical protein
VDCKRSYFYTTDVSVNLRNFWLSQRTVCELASIFYVLFANISSIRYGNIYIAANVVRFDTLSFKSRIYRSIYRQQNH